MKLFHAQNEQTEWTKSRVITLIDTLPPGSLGRSNQGWIVSAGSQAQVWPLLPSFSVIAPWQSVPISSPAKQPRGTCSAVNSPMPCAEIQVWKEGLSMFSVLELQFILAVISLSPSGLGDSPSSLIHPQIRTRAN